MKLINYILASMLLLTAGLFSGCSDDDDSRAGAVLSSATSLNFSSTDAGTKTIMIYADGDWTVEAPEWVVVTPDHGSMTMEVTVSAADNMRDGAVDNPRKENVIFKGRDLRSIAELLVVQAGDKFRDCPTVEIADVDGLDNEAVFEIKNAQVAALTASGFMISDGSVNVFVKSADAVEVGDMVDVRGEKAADNQKLAYVVSNKVTVVSSGSEVSYPNPEDITDKLATYTATTRKFIKVEGVMYEGVVRIEGVEMGVQLVDAPASFDLAELHGHAVVVTGYFGGVATPVIRLTPVNIVDNGEANIPEATIEEIASLVDASVIRIKEATVALITPNGFIVSDGSVGALVVTKNADVQVGDKVTVKAKKVTDGYGMPKLEPEKISVVSSGNEVTWTPDDITSSLATYTTNARQCVKVSGTMNGNIIRLAGSSASVIMRNIPAGVDVSTYGHAVTVTGFVSSVDAPVVSMTPASIIDNGASSVVYFAEDFEWLDPWAAIVPAGKTVEEDNLDATAPQISDKKKAGLKGETVEDMMKERGYDFLRVTTKTAGECIYLQRNYLKFGKTSYQAGIVLPKLTSISGSANVKLKFEWCPMRQGSGKIDPVNLIVLVDDKEYEVPTHGWNNGHTIEWIPAEVALTGVTKDSKIVIRQTQWPASTANRWFLDNISITAQ